MIIFWEICHLCVFSGIFSLLACLVAAYKVVRIRWFVIFHPPGAGGSHLAGIVRTNCYLATSHKGDKYSSFDRYPGEKMTINWCHFNQQRCVAQVVWPNADLATSRIAAGELGRSLWVHGTGFSHSAAIMSSQAFLGRHQRQYFKRIAWVLWLQKV